VRIAAETRARTVTRGRPLRVAMLLRGMYPWDERVKREAQALADAGHEVDVVCLQHPSGGPANETVDGVRVHRLPLSRAFTHKRASYLVQYGAAFAGCLWRLTLLDARHRYDVVQVHTLPDFLVFATVFARLRGARILLDMHDLMPELYMSKFGLAAESRVVRALRVMERAATSYSHHVITASEAFRERLIESGVPADKVTVVLNTADPDVFPPPTGERPSGSGDRFTVFWHGTMVRRYGLDLALRAVASLRDAIPGLRLVIYGDGECAGELRDLARELALEASVEFRGYFSHLEMARHIADADADVGIVPNRPDVHIEMAYPTKLFEFVQMGVPVVATRTRVLSRMFGEDAVVFCEATPESIATGLEWTYLHPAQAQAAARRARELCEPVSWERMKVVYVDTVVALAGRESGTDQAAQR
jgi:glycosyltransferase involved in cell wall biosynthesis